MRQATFREMHERKPGPGRPKLEGLRTPLEGCFPLYRTQPLGQTVPMLTGSMFPDGCLLFPGRTSLPSPTNHHLTKSRLLYGTSGIGCHLRIERSRVVVSCSACLWRSSLQKEPGRALELQRDSICTGLQPAFWRTAFLVISGRPGPTVSDAHKWTSFGTKVLLHDTLRSTLANRAVRAGAFTLHVDEK